VRCLLWLAVHSILLAIPVEAQDINLPVNDFLYQLQNIDLEAIGETAYDLVVIDYSADGSDETAFSADQIAALRDSPGGQKIVLSYLSIGEAEDYRFYWQEAWYSNPPDWLDEENSDWEGNYKVRYWEPEWQAIIFGSPDSYLDRIIAAGFDGVYLDLIDAYVYYEERGRETAAREMVDFVIALAEYAREQHPGFLIFPQNAPQLAVNFPEYLQTVDGIGQEDIYYGYPDEGIPSPEDFVAELEPHLDLLVDAGKTVLVIGYTTDAAQIAEQYQRAGERGYISFATVRELDVLTINPGFEPD
jgi:cysteinyl-tRNA synthetase, unknown class